MLGSLGIEEGKWNAQKFQKTKTFTLTFMLKQKDAIVGDLQHLQCSRDTAFCSI